MASAFPLKHWDSISMLWKQWLLDSLLLKSPFTHSLSLSPVIPWEQVKASTSLRQHFRTCNCSNENTTWKVHPPLSLIQKRFFFFSALFFLFNSKTWLHKCVTLAESLKCIVIEKAKSSKALLKDVKTLDCLQVYSSHSSFKAWWMHTVNSQNPICNNCTSQA